MKLGKIQKQWIKSLKENPERQGKNTLGLQQADGTYIACCLGELGIIAGVTHWNRGHLFSGSLARTLCKAHANKLGLVDEIGSSTDPSVRALANLNDNTHTWPEIAAVVEKNPELYFTKSY